LTPLTAVPFIIMMDAVVLMAVPLLSVVVAGVRSTMA
jgi:hypothetical protein